MNIAISTVSIAPAQPQKLLYFRGAQAARDYRFTNGTGGIIFTNEEMTILFPPYFTPIDIFNHPATRNRVGTLLSSQ